MPPFCHQFFSLCLVGSPLLLVSSLLIIQFQCVKRFFGYLMLGGIHLDIPGASIFGFPFCIH